MAKQVVNIVLNTEADKDIIRWLARQRNRSAAVREAIRTHLAKDGVTLGDVYQAVKRIERKLERGSLIVSEAPQGERWSEPPKAVEALDALVEMAS